MRRFAVVIIVLVTAGGVLAAAALVASEWGQPQAAVVSEQRLSSEMFGDPDLARCVADGFEQAGLPLDLLGALAGEDTAAANLAQQRRMDDVLDGCVDVDRLSADGELTERAVEVIRLDPSMPLAASNRD